MIPTDPLLLISDLAFSRLGYAFHMNVTREIRMREHA